ncbi:MAG: rhomboid family intramembrane serine protease [Betaproteobacteria bacterium]
MVALTLLAANVVVFAAFAGAGGGVMDADPQMLIRWGSNFGPYTADGQWWRLLSAAFLHGGLVHLAVNMVTLADVGRLCERLFGWGRFLTLYLLSGLAGSAASLWWNPQVNSVGASGALFGVLGAVLVFMLDRRNGIDPGAMKAHAASMAVFIAYGVVNGLASTNIDNAAHLGGLAAGAVLGFAFGRPPGSNRVEPLRMAAGIAACALAVAGLASLTPNNRAGFEAERQFREDLKAFTKEEERLVASLRTLIAKAQAPGAKGEELRPEAASIAAGWDAARQRFAAQRVAPESSLYLLQQDMAAYTAARHRAMDELVRAFEERQQPDARARVKAFNGLMKEGDAIVEKIQKHKTSGARDK